MKLNNLCWDFPADLRRLLTPSIPHGCANVAIVSSGGSRVGEGRTRTPSRHFCVGPFVLDPPLVCPTHTRFSCLWSNHTWKYPSINLINPLKRNCLKAKRNDRKCYFAQGAAIKGHASWQFTFLSHNKRHSFVMECAWFACLHAHTGHVYRHCSG